MNPSCGQADDASINRHLNAPKNPSTGQLLLPLNKVVPVDVKDMLPKISKQPKEVLAPVNKKKGAPVRAHVALSDKDDEKLLDNKANQLEAGHVMLYRGDTRSPAAIKAAGGFAAWVPLNVATARDVIRRALGWKFPLSFPKAGARLEKEINDLGQMFNLLLLARQIKATKTRDTFHVSTDFTEECGGYSNGYIYAMRFAKMNMSFDSYFVEPLKKDKLSAVKPRFVMDTPSLATASTIGVAIDKAEIAFLTTIPVAQIIKYKEPKGVDWYDMPA